MKVPTSGPKVIAHNQMMDREQTFWFLIHEEKRSVKVLHTDFGPLIIAFTDEGQARKAVKATSGEYFSCHLGDINMTQFFYIILGNPENKDIKGILLNPSNDLLENESFSNDIVLKHVFLGEEMDLQGLEEALEKEKSLREAQE